MKKNFALIAVVLAGAMALQSCKEARQPAPMQVATEAGIVEGFMEDSVRKFLGIPYATPPVGELRWTAPQPMAHWDGVREAKAFGNDPMQPNVFGDMNFRGPEKSEDCLYLNIWTPTDADSTAGLPVLIYFNGGGLIAGSGSEPRYDGTALAKRGVIGVTANYREGVFGYLAHPELSEESSYGGSGNYGFLDQAAAIQWVVDNIKAFGGDPKRITIAGESAGSFSVSQLMCSPLSKNNIAGVIGSSGAEVMSRQPVPLKEAELAGKQSLEDRGIANIAAARAIPADSLQAMMPIMMASPVLDGYFISESCDETFSKGEQAQVPMLAGWNSLEGVPQATTVKDYKDQLRPMLGDMTDEIFEAYGILQDSDVMSQKGFNLAGDLFTGFPTWKWCDYQGATANPVYRYKYNHPRPRPSAKMGDKVGALAGGVREKTEEEKAQDAPQIAPGAVHSADIEYAMGTLDTNEYYDWQPEDYAISDLFLSYYVNFAKTGNPNGPGLPQWTPINGQTVAPVMQIDVESQEVADPDLENAYRTLEKYYVSKLK